MLTAIKDTMQFVSALTNHFCFWYSRALRGGKEGETETEKEREKERETTDQIRHGRLMLAGSRNLFTGNKRKKPKPHVHFTYENTILWAVGEIRVASVCVAVGLFS